MEDPSVEDKVASADWPWGKLTMVEMATSGHKMRQGLFFTEVRGSAKLAIASRAWLLDTESARGILEPVIRKAGGCGTCWRRAGQRVLGRS